VLAAFRRAAEAKPLGVLKCLVAGLLVLALASCAEVQSFDDMLDGHVDTDARPKIVGARGPLSAAQTKAILAHLRAGSGDADILQRHLLIEQAVAENPLVAGNTTHLLHDGETTFWAIFNAIRSAKDHINLEYFTFEDIESDGAHLGDLLVAKRAQGVAVNVIYDSYGSGETPPAFFDRLKKAGVKIVEFNPLNPLDAKAGYSINDRDHRKILIVDGTTAIVGGVNLSKSYQSRSPGRASEPAGSLPQHWRDTDLEIEGSAVAQLQKLFIAHWHEQKGPPLDEANFFPVQKPVGNELIRIIGSTPANETPRYYVTLLSAIRSAEKSIWLSAAYFVPTHDEMEDLEDAARRGVDVRLLLPSQSDSELALNVGRSHYEDLMEAGVKIYEVQNEVLHSKTAVIDGVWMVIGSSNFDQRSVLFNDEVDAVVLGKSSAGELEEMFRVDQAAARPIDPRAWDDRPLSDKVEELYSRIWQALL
jgi:cardiolipin synthase